MRRGREGLDRKGSAISWTLRPIASASRRQVTQSDTLLFVSADDTALLLCCKAVTQLRCCCCAVAVTQLRCCVQLALKYFVGFVYALCGIHFCDSRRAFGHLATSRWYLVVQQFHITTISYVIRVSSSPIVMQTLKHMAIGDALSFRNEPKL